MTERDLQLIKNIVKFLAEEPDARPAPVPQPIENSLAGPLPSFRFSSASLSAPTGEAASAAAPTSLQLAELEAELAQAKAEAAQLRKERQALLHEREGLREEVESMRQMFAMTYEFMQQGGTGEPALADQLEATWERLFDPQPRLDALFPGALYQATEGQAAYLFEKFGLAHLVLVRNPFAGVQAALFKALVGFALQQVVASRRNVSPTDLVGELLQFAQSALGAPAVEACALVIDPQNAAVEFSGTGAPLYVRTGGHTGEYASGPAPTGEGFAVQRPVLRPGAVLVCGLPAAGLLPWVQELGQRPGHWPPVPGTPDLVVGLYL
jgi:hypothetical protein